MRGDSPGTGESEHCSCPLQLPSSSPAGTKIPWGRGLGGHPGTQARGFSSAPLLCTAPGPLILFLFILFCHHMKKPCRFCGSFVLTTLILQSLPVWGRSKWELLLQGKGKLWDSGRQMSSLGLAKLWKEPTINIQFLLEFHNLPAVRVCANETM